MTIEELQDERRRVNSMSDDELTAEMRQYWDGSVEVLGTQFNLRCYAADSHTLLALDRGAVRLAAATGGSEVIMRQGDMASLDNSTGHIDVRHHADSYQTKAWLRNEMVFDKAPLDSVMEAIGQCYGRRIRIEGNYRDTDTFGGTLATDNLSDTLGVLSSLYHLNIENNGNDIVMRKKKWGGEKKSREE